MGYGKYWLIVWTPKEADNRGLASPYLLELGLSKSLMSLVFVAGPLSGLIMQPLIGEYIVLACSDTHQSRLIVLERGTGIFADRSQSRFGRRRPFMIVGCVVSVFAMMLLGWAREISAFFGGVSLGGQVDRSGKRSLIMTRISTGSEIRYIPGRLGDLSYRLRKSSCSISVAQLQHLYLSPAQSINAG